MIIIDRREDLSQYIKNGTAMALGNFDGLHRAHMKIIQAAVDYAKSHGTKSVVYMFREHPSNFIEGLDEVKYITPNQYKEEILKTTQVDILYYESFPHMEKKSPIEFLNYLAEQFRVKYISAGFNFTFGYHASGNEQFLREQGSKMGIDVDIIPRESYHGEVISSSRIRELIREGNVFLASRFLGRPYFVLGVVEHGRKLGTNLTFPTINSHVNEIALLPKNGVYITRTFIDGILHKSITNIGIKPTIGGEDLTVETYIIDFKGDLYGRNIKIDFLDRIRDERKFDSLEALKEQISKDVKTAAAYEHDQAAETLM